MRRTWLRCRENVYERCLIHQPGYNLGILMRGLFGVSTPGEAAKVRFPFRFVNQAAEAIAFVIFAVPDAKTEVLIVPITGGVA